MYEAFNNALNLLNATLPGLPIQVQIIAVLIILLTFAFIWKYAFRGLFLSIRISILLKELRRFRDSGGIDPSDIFSGKKGRVVQHFWNEYRDTLHTQRALNSETGEEEITAIRATAPAEAFFSAQSIVDSRLSADFFKHLPGIFTGLGIIGTFSGLIKGLRAFNVSENTEIVRKSLESLLSGVSEAFIVSAIAIGLAMFVTIVEKALIANLHRKIELLCHIVDGLFETGAGEEYLERLVKASEDSTINSRNLKDSLLLELKQTMHELNLKQINAFNEQISIFAKATLTGQKELGDQIVMSIEAGIAKPLESIAGVFRVQRENAGSELSSALSEVLSGFSKDQKEIFGGQMNGFSDIQQKTLSSLESAVSHLDRMMADLNKAGLGAADAMAKQLTDAVSSMETRQRMMNATMSEFVEQIKNLVSQSQTETARKLQEIISDLGSQVTLMFSELKTQSREMSELSKNTHGDISQATVSAIGSVSSELKNSMQTMQSQILHLLQVIDKQQERFIDRTEKSVSQLSTVLGDTVSVSSEKSSSMLSNLARMVETSNDNTATAVRSIMIAVSDLNDITGKSVSEMNEVAKNLLSSSEEFGRASKGLGGILDKLSVIGRDMSSSATAMTGSARMLEGISGDIRDSKESLASVLENIRHIVETAKREASLTSDILDRIEKSAQKLSSAQHQADGYLTSVSEVLTAAHRDFSSSMRSTLKEVNTQFFDHMTAAVSRLREGLEELEATIGRIGGNTSMEV